MATVEFRVKNGSKFDAVVERVPVAGDYLYHGVLGRVLAVVLTPASNRDAVAFVIRDPDGKPDELSDAVFG